MRSPTTCPEIVIGPSNGARSRIRTSAPGRILSALFGAALVVPNFERLNEWAKEKGVTIRPESIDANPEVRRLFQAELDTYNTGVPHHEQVRAFALLPADLTIEDGSITPTLKVKRRILENRYQKLIDAMYQAAEKQHVA